MTTAAVDVNGRAGAGNKYDSAPTLQEAARRIVREHGADLVDADFARGVLRGSKWEGSVSIGPAISHARRQVAEEEAPSESAPTPAPAKDPVGAVLDGLAVLREWLDGGSPAAAAKDFREMLGLADRFGGADRLLAALDFLEAMSVPQT